MLIRKMTAEDLPAVCRLEEECFSDAWSEALIRDMLAGEYDFCRVLVEDEAVRGYINVRVLGDEAELMRICIAKAYRGRGLSGPLLKAGIEDMKEHGAEAATLEVRAGNTAAVRLYEAHGFLLAGTRRNYYRDPVEDASIYWNRSLKGEE